MGDSLATRAESTQGSDGGRGRVVRTDWGSQHGASSLAVCQSGGAKSAKGAELGYRRLGRHGAQDGSFDSDDEEQDSDSASVESCCLMSLLHGMELFLSFTYIIYICVLHLVCRELYT